MPHGREFGYVPDESAGKHGMVPENKRGAQERLSPIQIEAKTNNSAEVKLANGTFTMFYADDTTSLKSWAHSSDVPSNVEGFVLELGSNYSARSFKTEDGRTGTELAVAASYITREPLASYYEPFLDYIHRHPDKVLPLYLHDLVFKDHKFSEARAREVLPRLAATVIGASVFGSVLKSQMSRRSFLKFGAAAGLGVTALYAAPELSKLAQIAAHYTGVGGEVTSAVDKKVKQLYPTDTNAITMSIRECVMAYKQQWLLDQQFQSSKHKTHLASVNGLWHRSGLENMLSRSQQEKLEFIKAALPLVKENFEPYSLYTIGKVRLEPTIQAQGQMAAYAPEWMEIPELRALVAH